MSTERAKLCLQLPFTPEGKASCWCLGVGDGLRTHKDWRPGGSEVRVRAGYYVGRGLGNRCCWGWVGGGGPGPSRGSWVGASAKEEQKSTGPEHPRTPKFWVVARESGRVLTLSDCLASFTSLVSVSPFHLSRNFPSVLLVCHIFIGMSLNLRRKIFKVRVE